MATKRKRSDEKKGLHSNDALRKQVSSAITDHNSAEIALLHIMDEYDFHPSHLQEILAGSPFTFSG